MNNISCIIPAHNEAARIGRVLEATATHPLISEVIVVDDASTDGTSDVVRRYPHATLIVHPKNKGKSKAIHTGVQNATGKFLFFLDSDLIGLTKENISDLIRPIIENKADISISLRRNAPSPWHWIGIDYISGERVLPRSLVVEHLDQIDTLHGFGLEVFLNSIIIRRRLRIKIVQWPNVDSPFKHAKHGLWAGIRGEARMMLHIFRTVGIFTPLAQIAKMMQLKVK